MDIFTTAKVNARQDIARLDLQELYGSQQAAARKRARAKRTPERQPQTVGAPADAMVGVPSAPQAASGLGLDRADGAPSGQAAASAATQFRNATNVLTRYVPTDVVVLYVAAIAIAPQFKEAVPAVTPATLYWGFAICTPLIFWLVYLGTLSGKQGRSVRRSLLRFPPRLPVRLPLWKPFAAFLAFMVWALAIPNGPYLQSASGATVAGFVALVASTVLGLAGGVVEKDDK